MGSSPSIEDALIARPRHPIGPAGSGEARPEAEASPPSTAERTRAELVDLLYRQLVPALLATVFNSILLGAVLWREVPQQRIVAWVSATVALSIVRYALILGYRRRRVDSRKPWLGLFLVGVAAAGAMWGAAAAFLFPFDSAPHQAFLALILCGMSTAAVASLGPVLPAFLLFLVPAIAPLAVRFFLLGEAGVGMGVLAVCFGLMMTMVARRFQRSVSETLALRFENVDLIDRLSVARRDAEAASRSKSQFLANMSHEIRTPMNGVLGMLELLQTTELDEKQAHFAGTAHRSGVALLHVINDILDFSKIESGQLELESIDFEVREIVEETAEFLAERAHRKQLELLCFVGESVPEIAIGDPHRLRQILTNLIANAIKFTEEGEVSVRVSAEPDPAGHRLQIEVRDTGIGIDEGAQRKIFDSFTQADNATTRRYGGTGLGLAIVQQLVESMHGTVALDSKLGEGTHVRVEVLVGGSAKSVERFGEIDDQLRSLYGLIVDDNATNRSILEHQLTRFGVAAESVPDAASGLARLLEACKSGRPFDLAILDMSMPGMDGLQMARAIRAQPELDDLRLLMLTSVGEFGDAALAREAGIEIYLTKPARQTHLYESLVDLMSGRPRERSGREAPVQFRFDKTVRVLLAEDHRVNREVAIAMLEGFGCEVQAAHHGAEAVALSGASRFDVILMDCQMPRMDGFEATRAIVGRSHPSAPPIVALTAHAADGDKTRCFAAGMSGYLSKPFSREELFRAIAEATGRVVARPVVSPSRAPSSIGAEPVTAGAAEREPVAPGKPVSVEPILSEEAIQRLRALESNSHPDVVSRVMRFYLDDSDALFATMRDATAAGDADRLGSAAHTLKSSTANLGAIDLSEICRSIEDAAKTGEIGGLDDLLAEADRLQARVRAEVQRRLGTC